MHATYKGIREIFEIKLVGSSQTPWIKFVDIDGKVRCRFVKKFEAKYLWNCDLTQVWSLERMQFYSVSQNRCSCPSYRYSTGLISGTCKHQRMKSVLEKQQLTETISANTGRKWMTF